MASPNKKTDIHIWAAEMPSYERPEKRENASGILKAIDLHQIETMTSSPPISPAKLETDFLNRAQNKSIRYNLERD